MSKFNTSSSAKPAGRGPVVTTLTPDTLTHEGAPAYTRDTKSELFLLAVSNFVGEDTFYETAAARDARYAQLVATVAVSDPDWAARFLAWLRSEAHMRSASLVGALEAARAMLGANIPGGRGVVASVLQRADEPGEALAYWTSHYGRPIPKPVKRGVADAARRLYTERALLKYDTASHGFRFADVLDLCHPTPVAPWQADLFRVALARRHGRDEIPEIDERLPMLLANAALRSAGAEIPELLLDAERLRAAGMTWEDALSLVGSKVDKGRLWEALIPSMGYMALLRNLRGFDEAGVGDEVAAQVAAKLADPAEVARSRQLPYRFLAAYEQAPSLRWGHALDGALKACLTNIPSMTGRTLVLVDTSASMTTRTLSAKSTMTPAVAAAVFGAALASRGDADLFGFADGQFRHEVPKGASVLRETERFLGRTGEVGHSTLIAEAVRACWNGHLRVFIISDMQTMDAHVGAMLPPGVAMYGFNLGGYRPTSIPGGINRHEFGGLTDATFRMVPLIEAGRDAAWPF
jgi:TROVE domain